MSSYDAQSRAQETQQQQEKGVDAYLSQEERENLQRMLSFPEEFPRKFGAWIQDYITTNGVVLQSQVQGLSQFRMNVADPVLASETTTSTSYASLATPGPAIAGLSDGLYVVFVSALISNDTVGAISLMSAEANGAGLSDAQAAVAGTTGLVGSSAQFTMDLRNDNNNSLAAKYRVNGGTGSFVYRRLMALKVSN